MDDLETKNQIWQALPRNNPSELKFADDYFDQEIMPLDLQLFLNKHQSHEKYYSMILTLGTSWQPLALSLALIKPQKILFLYTKEVAPLIDKIATFLNLSPASYTAQEVQRSQSTDIYIHINSFYAQYSSYGPCCIDITGGTKAMSSAAAMIGTVLNLDIFYMESQYIPTLRRPAPGSSRPEKLIHPLTFFKTIQGK